MPEDYAVVQMAFVEQGMNIAVYITDYQVFLVVLAVVKLGMAIVTHAATLYLILH